MTTNSTGAPKGYKIPVQPYDTSKEYFSKDSLGNLVETKFMCELPVLHPFYGKPLFQQTESGCFTSANTLVFEKIEECTVWFNVYFKPGNSFEGGAHPTRELADMWARPNRIACVKVKFEVGEGL